MAPTPSLRMLFTIPVKGAPHQWSIRMHLAGGLPANSSEWHTLAEDIWTDMQPFLRTDVETTEWIGYANDTTPSVWNELVGASGTLSNGSDMVQAPYVCLGLKWTTTQRDSRGHPIYLRNFIHGAITIPGTVDEIPNAQATPAIAFAEKFSAGGVGYTVGGNTYHRAGPNGAVAQAGTILTYVTHRVLKRRG
jgi:hypothetical protein